MNSFDWIDMGNGRKVFRKVGPMSLGPRSDFPCPMFIPDTMDAIQHPCDGQNYDSKAKFRATTRAHGCEEVGNERPKPKPKHKPDRKAIRESLQKASAQLASR